MRKKRLGIDDGEAVVRLGREVHDDVDALVSQGALGELAVADVTLDEHDSVLDRGQVRAVAGVRQQVVDDDVVVGVALEPVVDEVGADEPGSARDEEAHRAKASARARRGMPGGLRASAGRHGRSGALAAEHGVRRSSARRRPSSSVLIRRTRQSLPASSKIASAKSAHVQSPPRPRGARAHAAASASTSSRTALARWSANVGQPLWSSTTDDLLLRRHRARSIVRTKLRPVAPKSHDVRTIQASARRSLAEQLRAAVGGERVRRVGLDVRLALAHRRRRSPWRT